jgi:hypothetical protein
VITQDQVQKEIIPRDWLPRGVIARGLMNVEREDPMDLQQLREE